MELYRSYQHTAPKSRHRPKVPAQPPHPGPSQCPCAAPPQPGPVPMSRHTPKVQAQTQSPGPATTHHNHTPQPRSPKQTELQVQLKSPGIRDADCQSHCAVLRSTEARFVQCPRPGCPPSSQIMAQEMAAEIRCRDVSGGAGGLPELQSWSVFLHDSH